METFYNHYLTPILSIFSNITKAMVFVKGFFITLGARPLKASPDLNRFFICNPILPTAVWLLVRT